MGARFGGHLWAQRAGLWAQARLVSGTRRGKEVPQVPAPALEAEVSAPSLSLQADFIKFCGGDPAHYRSVIPPHLFSQWTLPWMLEAAARLPYPPLKVINTGVDVEFLAALPQTRTLRVRTQLLELEEQERAVCLLLAVTTLLPNGQDAVRARLSLRVRKPRPAQSAASATSVLKRREEAPELVAEGARELSRSRLRGVAGLECSRLTGDFNPIHWSQSYARRTGLPGVVLQGFASFGLLYEALTRGLLSGDVAAIARLRVQFLRPLDLPADVGIYLSGSRLSLAEAVGAPAYVTGEVSLRPLKSERG